MRIRLKQIDQVLSDRANFMRALKMALPLTGLDATLPGTIQFVFLPKAEMAELNGLHLHHEGATDVITYDLRDEAMDNDFPMIPDESPDTIVLAEIYVCPEVAAEYAKICNTSQSHELFLYSVHGMLHLAGEDDLTDEARISMRAAEARVLSAVEKKFNLNNF